MGIAILYRRSNLKAIVLSTLIATTLPSFANSQTNSAAENPNWEVTVDIGRLIFPRGFSVTGWEQLYSTRAGVGCKILEYVWGHAYVEYRRYNSGLRWGDRSAQLFERDYPRSDVAFYFSVTALRWFQLGAGAIAQFHQDMSYHWWNSYSGHDSTKHTLRAPRGLKLFFIGGVKYDIPLANNLYIPVGIFFDSYSRFYPAARIGIAKRL